MVEGDRYFVKVYLEGVKRIVLLNHVAVNIFSIILIARFRFEFRIRGTRNSSYFTKNRIHKFNNFSTQLRWDYPAPKARAFFSTRESLLMKKSKISIDFFI